MAKAEVDIKKFTKDHTLNVKVNFTKQFRFRVIAAIYLVKMAALILGCNINIEESNDVSRGT